eukprot:m.96328 g.96328  ORF g.96328 m.96328 type:complete len:162 (+) comp13072_c0_seq1:2680-3165(+)
MAMSRHSQRRHPSHPSHGLELSPGDQFFHPFFPTASLFPHSFFDHGERAMQTYNGLGSVDIHDTEASLDLTVDVPGLAEEDVKVNVKDGVMSISGERTNEKEETTDGTLYQERSYGKFSRQFTLPANTDPAHITANVRKGVLYISVPKSKDDGVAISVSHE